MKRITVIKILVWVAALYPAAALAYGFYAVYSGVNPDALTADPAKHLTNETGTWALAFLVISLCITPLRRFTHWNEAIKLRRPLGLFSFFYGTLHMLTWVVFINVFDVRMMIEDVVKRPFITIGMTTWLILLALALTSTTFAIRKMGRKWQTLHRFVYAAAIGAVVHFWWLVKADITVPRRWAVAVALLLTMRLWWAWQKRQRLSFNKDGR